MELASSIENNSVSDLILKLCNHLARNDPGKHHLKSKKMSLLFILN